MMRRLLSLICVAMMLALGVWLLGREGRLAPETTARRQVMSRMVAQPGGTGGNKPAAPTVAQIGPVAPVVVRLDDLPRGAQGPSMYQRWINGEIDLDEQHELVTDWERGLALAAALAMPADGDVQQIRPAGASASVVSFDAIDFNEAQDANAGAVPPDPILAVGPSHMIAAVNVAFQVYDKTGNSLSGIVAFSTFFQNLLQCVDFAPYGPFDPVALYDEEEDRYIIGVDANGDHICLAVSATGNPRGEWFQYAFPTDIGNTFFDFPQGGVGHDAIYVGSNQFNNSTGLFQEGRLWAFDKVAMYDGDPAASRTQSIGDDGTPLPMQLHGAAQGTWPESGPHYILASRFPDWSNPNDHVLYSWRDPFGANVLAEVETFDLTALTSVSAAQPVPAPQLGNPKPDCLLEKGKPEPLCLQANDVRQLDLEYRNGHLWTAMTISCNPGGGTVNCVRWAEIDPAAATVIQAGVFASNSEHRTFPDLAVDRDGNVAIGYTRTSQWTYPSVWAACRGADTPAGEIEFERPIKPGETTYVGLEQEPTPYRWGDYTGMTIDPDGETFWYLGQYSKDLGSTSNMPRWGTYIVGFRYDQCELLPQQYVPFMGK